MSIFSVEACIDSPTMGEAISWSEMQSGSRARSFTICKGLFRDDGVGGVLVRATPLQSHVDDHELDSQNRHHGKRYDSFQVKWLR